jgi:hypothetical protein
MNKPNRSYSVIVPTKAYLRKYIYAEYGHPLELNYLTTLGNLVLCMLGNEYFSVKMNNNDKDTRIQYMNDKIEFMAPLSTMQYKGHSLSKDRIIAINRFIEDDFVSKMSLHVQKNLKNRSWRPGYKDAIYAFAEENGIDVEIDITFEALKKAESRYRDRERLKKEKKLRNISERNVPPPNRSINSLFFPQFAYC